MQILHRIRARARYILDRAFAREFAAQLGLFVLLVIVVTLLGMTAVFFGLFAPHNLGVEGIPRDIDSAINYMENVDYQNIDNFKIEAKENLEIKTMHQKKIFMMIPPVFK